jgi:hypothetical protein
MQDFGISISTLEDIAEHNTDALILSDGETWEGISSTHRCWVVRQDRSIVELNLRGYVIRRNDLELYYVNAFSTPLWITDPASANIYLDPLVATEILKDLWRDGLDCTLVRRK